MREMKKMLSDQALGLLNLALFAWTLIVAAAILYSNRARLRKPPMDEKQAIEAGRRNESVSLTLGGFTLAALAIVIAFQEIPNPPIRLGFPVFFFLLSFVMFIISVVLFANRAKIVWKELGGIAQDYGILLIAVGLAALLDAVNILNSLTIIPLVILGVFVASWQVADIIMVHKKTKRR
jgi:hypothetical protein